MSTLQKFVSRALKIEYLQKFASRALKIEYLQKFVSRALNIEYLKKAVSVVELPSIAKLQAVWNLKSLNKVFLI